MFNFFRKESLSPLSGKEKPDLSNKDRTTKTIALVLLYTFIASVTILFLTNIFIEKLLTNDTNGDFRKGWFDLLKNALVLLGTALTTVIGYYFGQREGAIKAEQAEKKIEATDRQAQKTVERVIQQRDNDIRDAISKESDPLHPDAPTSEESADSGIKPPQ